MKTMRVYIESGKKRIFANAIDWPGWSRSGADETSALQALCNYGSRYAQIIGKTGLGYQMPEDMQAFIVVERLDGNTTTDFGAPAVLSSFDSQPVDAAELHRFQILLGACWQAFDMTVKAAHGKELRKGPRGGGRGVEEILQHVLGAEVAYLGSLGWKYKQPAEVNIAKEADQIRQAVLEALTASAHAEIPVRGPRGGLRWTPRYYVRRAAWHILDHVWEIEERLLPG